MPLPGTVLSASPAILGFDADTTVTPALAQQFAAEGYEFCLRYLSRSQQKPTDLSAQEATDILNAGLALMAVQHANVLGWPPSQALGQQDGQAAATNAGNIGIPPGVCVWCDLEGVSTDAVGQDVIDYCEAWFAAVNVAGYVPGLYVGAYSLLTGRQLYDLSFQHYWRSQSQVPNIPGRGYQLLQLYPQITVNGIEIDVNVTQNDYEGGVAQWLCV
jgi:hypothetical protein